MQSGIDLQRLSDAELVRRLGELVSTSRRVEADLVAHVGEVEARRLYAREASPSMFSYCTRRLHLSEAEAYLRITVARAARRHAVLLEMLRDGRLHLRAIALLAPLLTTENRDALLARATHRSRREVEELVAELRPRPDVPTRVRRLPQRRVSFPGVQIDGPDPSSHGADAPLPQTARGRRTARETRAAPARKDRPPSALTSSPLAAGAARLSRQGPSLLT